MNADLANRMQCEFNCFVSHEFEKLGVCLNLSGPIIICESQKVVGNFLFKAHVVWVDGLVK